MMNLRKNIRVLAKEQVKELVRYVIVGAIATLIHYGIYCLSLEMMNLNVAYILGYVVSLMLNYIMTSYFTFRVGMSLHKACGFVFSHFVALGMQITLLNLFLYIGVSKVLAPIPTYLISIPIGFVLIRFFLRSKYR